MLRITCLLLFTSSLLFSCDETNSNAEKVCDCYTLMHREKNHNRTQVLADSCNNIYSEIQKDLKNNTSEMDAFNKGLEKCR